MLNKNMNLEVGFRMNIFSLKYVPEAVRFLGRLKAGWWYIGLFGEQVDIEYLENIVGPQYFFHMYYPQEVLRCRSAFDVSPTMPAAQTVG